MAAEIEPILEKLSKIKGALLYEDAKRKIPILSKMYIIKNDCAPIIELSPTK